MKRSIARKWAKALESGDYGQTTGKLRKGDKFCCLGVLCNLHAQKHPEIAAKQRNKQEYLGESALPPNQVVGWAGMNEDNPSVVWNGVNTDLAGLNDTHKLTFPEIAKVIRKHWKEL